MKASTVIQRKIMSIPKGRPFKASQLMRFGSYANVRQVLSRLVKTEKLSRVTRGIYVRAKENPYIGKVLPSAQEVVKVIAQNSGEQVTIHGAAAANLLELSTQVPMQTIFLTSGRSRRIKFGNREVVLKHANSRKLMHSNTPGNLAINALWYLGKPHVNITTIEHIRQKLKPEDYEALLHSTSQMPAWMASTFYQYQQKLSDHGR